MMEVLQVLKFSYRQDRLSFAALWGVLSDAEIADLAIGVQLKSEDGSVLFNEIRSLHERDVRDDVEWEYLMEEFSS